MSNEKKGHVYIIVSPKTEFIKIGGTSRPPTMRLREINTQSSSPYYDLGPWRLEDFRQVDDWEKVERHLHDSFRSSWVTSVNGIVSLRVV